MSEIIGVVSNKGGVLKTSLVSNLAVLLSQHKKRVLIIDLDSQGNQALAWGANPDSFQTTVYDVLMGKAPLSIAVVNVAENIDLLPSNSDLSFAEFDILPFIGKKDPFAILSRMISKDLKEYDTVLIDTPPNVGLLVGNALAMADRVLSPFAPETFSQQSLLKTIEVINDFKQKYNNINNVTVIPVLIDHTYLHNVVLQSARQWCEVNKVDITETVIPRSIRFANSTAFNGVPLLATNDNSKFSDAYRSLYSELHFE